MALMVEAFSLLAVGTSLIGTLLGFSQFFREQLRNSLCPQPAPEQGSPLDHISSREEAAEFGSAIPPPGVVQEDAAGGCSPRSRRSLEDWWVGNNLNLGAMSMAVIPALLVSTTVPDAFYLATDIAVRGAQGPSSPPVIGFDNGPRLSVAFLLAVGGVLHDGAVRDSSARHGLGHARQKRPRQQRGQSPRWSSPWTEGTVRIEARIDRGGAVRLRHSHRADASGSFCAASVALLFGRSRTLTR